VPNALALRSGAVAGLRRTTNAPLTSNATVMGWVNLAVLPNTAARSNVAFWVGGNEENKYVCYVAGYNALQIWNGLSGSLGTVVLVAKKWYHVCLTLNGTSGNNALGYLDGRLEVTSAARSLSSGQVGVGIDVSDSSWWDGWMAALKIWNRALSQAEIVREMPFALPVSRVGLNSCYPIPSVRDTLTAREYGPPGWGDWSGHKYEWTKTGVITIVPGPPGLR
jgi:hypothetical protein